MKPAPAPTSRRELRLAGQRGYLFTDEQAEYNKQYPKRRGYDMSKPFYGRYSFDFIYAVFDVNTGTIYVWSINT
jgi:hypothetical protein